ncbi:MAG: LCP family protein [Actinomycetota bacterium]|nr:LCP family protein [Actinomycetota bacterium]
MSSPLPPPSARPLRGDLHRARRRGRGPIGPSPVRLAKRRWPRRVLIGTLSLVALVVLAAAAATGYAWYRFGQFHKVAVSGLAPRQGSHPFDILLVGSDSRAFVSTKTQAAQFGSAAAQTGQRSDVIIVARIAPLTHSVELLSIPRDTFVDIPGHLPGVSGPNRINAAFNRGPSLLVKTIDQSFHLPITYYAGVNFPGFAGMVNALGGIGLDFADPVKDAYSGLDITTTGCQSVDGAQALALVRSRHLYYFLHGSWNYDGNSDFSRIQRQDAFFRAVVAKLHSESMNPFALNGFLSAAAGNVTFDNTLSAGAAFSLARTLRSISLAGLRAETLPTIEAVVGGADVLVPAAGPDAQALGAFLAFGTTATPTRGALRAGTTGELTALHVADPASVTVTTLPGTGASGPVVYNNGPEPWNPVPCSP